MVPTPSIWFASGPWAQLALLSMILRKALGCPMLSLRYFRHCKRLTPLTSTSIGPIFTRSKSSELVVSWLFTWVAMHYLLSNLTWSGATVTKTSCIAIYWSASRTWHPRSSQVSLRRSLRRSVQRPSKKLRVMRSSSYRVSVSRTKMWKKRLWIVFTKILC